jgi:murein DD-endopeptidase MepM/ murein hydrolase activator NlpD
MPSDPNLFDGRLSVFCGQPDAVAETSLRQLTANLRAAAPSAAAVFVKTNHGAGWQGRREAGHGRHPAPNLAVTGIADVQRWAEELGASGLECHAWSVVRGSLVGPELDRLAQVCLEGGVRSLLLCLAGAGTAGHAWQAPGFVGDERAAEALAAGLRERIGPDFHLGLMFDARGDSPGRLFVQRAWFPEVDSLHPIIFHRCFGEPAGQALGAALDALGGWGKPIYPVLQAFDVPASETAQAVAQAAATQRVPGLSLFYYGRGSGAGLNSAELGQALAEWPRVLTAPMPERPAAEPHWFFSKPEPVPSTVVVDPDDERAGLFVVGYYGDKDELAGSWTRDRDGSGRARLFRPASYNRQTLYVGYAPRLRGKGTYHIEVFVPRNRATVRDAHYFVVDYPAGQRREVMAVIDQSAHHDAWVRLEGAAHGEGAGGRTTEFHLDPKFSDAGRVNVADVTFVEPAEAAGAAGFEISFGAIRWRPAEEPAGLAASFDSPVGTEEERAGPFAEWGKLHDQYSLWCGRWYDANPYGTRYLLGDRHARHTGADLNLDGPGGVLADKDAPVYAIADGRVISAGFVSPGWKNVIVIEHPVPGEDRVVYARYAHVAAMRVRANELVRRGQQICTIGEYAPNNYHLHFDISPDPILKTVPGHWPGDSLDRVLRHYVDPMTFIKQRHVIR